MKTRTQKLISLVLVLVMLVSMVPMGIFSVSAEASAELTAGLANYDNTTEFVINSVEDWNAIAAAASGWNFAGKTITLNADLSNATLKTLAPNAFNGTFDGGNHTLTNITVDGQGLLATRINASTVKDLKIDGLTVSGFNSTKNAVGGLAAWSGPWGAMTFDNITMKNVDVTLVGSKGHVGALIGYMENNDNADGTRFYLHDITVEGAVKANNTDGTAIQANMGGLIGMIYARREIAFENVYCDVDVTSIYDFGGNAPDPARNFSVGGFIGCAYSDSTYTGTLNFTNCVSAGTLTHGGVTGGYIGYAQKSTSKTMTMNYTNCISASTYNVSRGGWSYLAAFSVTRGNPSSNWTKCGVTLAPNLSNDSTHPNSYFFSISGSDSLNGSTTLGAQGATQLSNIKDIPVVILADVVTYDATNNHIKAVDIYCGATPELFAALKAYDTTTEFVIKSVADWKLIARSGQLFKDKTIKLASDINANNTALPQLSAEFAGTFDGQNHTISNVTFNHRGLFGNYFQGNLKNLKLNNVHNVYTGDSGAIGLLAGQFAGNFLTNIVENIIATNISVTAGNVANVGLLFGSHNVNTAGNTTYIQNITISGSVTSAGLGVGGLIGRLDNGGDTLIQNIKTDISVKSTNDASSAGDAQGVAGMIGSGYVGGTGHLTFQNCYIGGSLDNSNGQVVCGVFGIFTGGAKTINLHNVIIATKVNSTSRSRCLIGYTKGAGNITYSNLFTTETVYRDSTNPNEYRYIFTLFNPLLVNGVSNNGELCVDTFKDIVKVSDEKAATLYKTDANGYVNYVYDHIDAEGVQVSAVANNAYAVRFIAVSQLAEATDVNMVVIATYTDGTGTHKIKFDSAKCKDAEGNPTPGCKLYDSLTVYGDHGISERATADKYGAEKLAGFTIYGIPTGVAISFEVTTSYVDTVNNYTVVGVNTMTVNFDANGALIK